MDEVKQNILNELRTKLEEIAAHNAATLGKGVDLGAINFQEGEGLFQEAIDLAKEARAYPKTSLSSRRVHPR